MLGTWANSILSVALVSAISLVGAFVFMLRGEPNRDFLLCLVSFSVGGLFGGALFHLIPEAAAVNGFDTQLSLYILLGIISSFVVEQVLRWRHCHIPTSEEHPHSFAYMNLFGDAVHNFIDGVAVGGAYLASTSMGLATTLAICLHELPQEMGDMGVLIYAGFEKRRALFYNFLTALTAIVGSIFALILSVHVEGLTAFLVPFAAGNFIYIAGSDLIPELHAEETLSRTVLQIASMVLGALLLFSIRFLVVEAA
jgi:zinc and cadmium transporter